MYIKHDSTIPIPGEEAAFSFAEIEVDKYKTAMAAWGYFYPRMLKGGSIAIPEYDKCQDIKSATDVFLHDKPEELETNEGKRFIVKQ